MKLPFLILFCFIVQSSYSQAPSVEWEKALGGSLDDIAWSIYHTTDGGSIVAGMAGSSDGDVAGNHSTGVSDAWVVKLDAHGTIQWQKCLGGSNEDIPFAIKQTLEGGYIMAAGTSSYDGDVDGFHGAGDGWIVKLNATGNILWQKCLGGSKGDEIHDVQQTSDTGFIVAGYTTSNDLGVSNHGSNDLWVVKLDKNGTMEWQKCLGGSGSDIAWKIEKTFDNGYVVAGYTTSKDGDVSGYHGETSGQEDAWIVKLDAGGNLEWQKCLGGTSYELHQSIKQTADSGYVMACLTNSNDGDVSGNHGGDDYWVVKLDKQANITWQKCYGGSGDELPFEIQVTKDGYVVGGQSASTDGDISGNHGGIDYWIVKIDATGKKTWEKTLGGEDFDAAQSINYNLSDESYLVAGYSNSYGGDVTGNHGLYDYWIVKLHGNDSPVITEPFPANSCSGKFDVTIMPNPAHNEVRVRFLSPIGSVPVYVRVITTIGQVVSVYKFVDISAGTEKSINLTGLASGLYFLQFMDNGKQCIIKIIKH